MYRITVGFLVLYFSQLFALQGSGLACLPFHHYISVFPPPLLSSPPQSQHETFRARFSAKFPCFIQNIWRLSGCQVLSVWQRSSSSSSSSWNGKFDKYPGWSDLNWVPPEEMVTCEVRLNVFIMIDFSKKLRRIVCILARWDVRLRFTIPSRDTSEVRAGNYWQCRH